MKNWKLKAWKFKSKKQKLKIEKLKINKHQKCDRERDCADTGVVFNCFDWRYINTYLEEISADCWILTQCTLKIFNQINQNEHNL